VDLSCKEEIKEGPEMHQIMAGSRTLLFLLLLALIQFAGCNKPAPTPLANAPMQGAVPKVAEADTPTAFAAGKKVFDANCAKCHSTRAEGGLAGNGGFMPPKGKGFGKGPNLVKVSADPNHTHQWLVDHIRDPKTHKPESRMPKFAGRLQEDDLNAVADYLGSLKGS
jgi:mono/diheme cytochrome c family protein